MKKVRKRRIKTAVFYDEAGSMGQTWEEQRDRDLQFYTECYFDEKVVLDWYDAKVPSDIKPKTELILFDYGGIGYGSLMEDMSKWIVRYAQDNPSCLVLVTSSFTYGRAIKYELEAIGCLSLPNIISYFDRKNEEGPPEWFLTGRDSPIPDKMPVCDSCESFAPSQVGVYVPEMFACLRCRTVVGACCWDTKKKKCADCAGW